MSYHEVIAFWFNELKPSDWWKKNIELDQFIKERFGKTHLKAVSCELYKWRESAEGRLAEIIVLDQFSRNIYRGQARAFAADSLALGLAQEAVALGVDKELEARQIPFLYMPYMHSESKEIHKVAVSLFSRPQAKGNLEYEIKHKEIIDRFGRYPHRNEVLGRQSTAEELEFLKKPGSSF